MGKPRFICANCGRVFSPKIWAMRTRCPHCGHIRDTGQTEALLTLGIVIGLVILVGAFVYIVLTGKW
jgi:Zn finger protein HypA/HybF involved in hydrogenase expression